VAPNNLGMRSKCTALRALVTASAILLGGTVALAEDLDSTSMITGTATYRERIALPPGAVLEVTLEDISRADAPALVIGQTRIESPGSPPFQFSITFDPARVQVRHRYAVRARITLDDQLLFTTDTVQPVLGESDRTSVDLILRRAGAGATAVTPPAKAAPSEPARRIRGAYSYLADAGFFTDCRSGQRLPVAQEGDNAALEAAYLSARRQPGAAVLAIVDGRFEMRLPMEGDQPQPTLVIERFVEVRPGGCETASDASLENTYWKLVQLDGAPVEVFERQREAHLILQPAQRRITGSGGCNRFQGSYRLEANKLSFGQVAATLMACTHGMEQERKFLDALARVGRWAVTGERLELFDASGAPLAQFDSVYLR